MNDILETLTYKNFTIDILPDDIGGDGPRDWDNLGTMVCWHRNYDLGDKHDFSTPDDFHEYINSVKAIVLPLYLYDHSGISMRTRSFADIDPGEWDSGQVGYIYVTYETLKKEYSVKRITKTIITKATKVLYGEVEVYDYAISGAVYGYRVKDPTGDPIDSCWGFYGYDHEKSGLLEYAHNAIDCHINNTVTDHVKTVKGYIKNHVPLIYRQPLTGV